MNSISIKKIKMRNNNYLVILILLAFTMTNCRKNFLDEPKPTQSVVGENVFASDAGVRAYFNGIYTNLRQQWAPIGAAVPNSTDSWGYNSISIARCQKGLDIINPGGWYQFDYRHENREPTFRRVIFVWGFFYEFINQANVLIKGVTESTLAENNKKKYIAEGRALRGWMYFELIREFQHSILKNAAASGVPIYTEPTSASNTGASRGTVQQVYDLINSDLTYAVANLDENRDIKAQVTKSVAYGMLARIKLEQGKWAEAAAAAVEAQKGYVLDPASYPDGYTDETSSEVMWSFPQSTNGMNQSLYYGTPSSFYEKTGNGYDNFYVNTDLVNSFSLTDVRNTFYVTSSSATNQRRYSTNKFGKGSGFGITLINGDAVELKETDFDEGLPMMRLAEMILIEAEANVELGQATKAKTLLYSLQKNRDAGAVQSANTGQALINEILLERRKEFYGELGLDYLDIKRRQLPLVRGGNHSAAYKFSMPANDNRLILKLPQREIDTNDQISDADQNP